jgi:hypothetical protein
MRRAFLIGLVVLGIWFYERTRPIPQPPGILAQDPPQISAVADKPPVFERNNHVLTGLAGFRAKARVLSVERYSRDRESRISPLDIVLGWGRLSDSVTLKGVDVAQTERRLLFKSYDPAFPDEVAVGHVLNLHLVAADEQIEARLKQLRAGSVVEIEGWLVEAVAGDGWRWRGEAREHTPQAPGNVVWVKRIEIDKTS